ncbi:methyl-accepting chemotaxis protein, partial [Thiobacillus sp. 63-78]|uniref:methyl-accepting chemotaxis protein n=1 Tax=Thiobacillus sp. 63-78 TaxID=1895859 RepID=UPI000AD6D381
MLNNITIKSRLVFVIGFLSLLLVAIGVLGLFSLSSTNESLRTVYEDRLVALGYLDTVATKMNQNQIDLNEVVAGQLSAFPPPVETVDKILVDVRKRIEEIETTWKAYRSTYATDEEEKLSAEFDTNRRNYGRLGVIPAIAAISAHDFQQAGEVLQGPLRETFLPAQKTMADLVKLQTEVGKQQYTDSQTRYARVRIIAIVSILIGVGLAAIVGYWLIRAITGPLNEAVRIAEAVAAGDLTQRIEVRSTDETGQLLLALKDMNESLGNIVGQVRTGTETITVASRQIATGNADLSSRTESQASSLEETAS